MAVQVRSSSAPGAISGSGTYGIGPFGIAYTYGSSGGTSGLQFQGSITVLGIAIKAQYQSGFDLGGGIGSGNDGSGNVQVQIGLAEIVGKPLINGGITLFAGIGYSTRD